MGGLASINPFDPPFRELRRGHVGCSDGERRGVSVFISKQLLNAGAKVGPSGFTDCHKSLFDVIHGLTMD